ncbi:MAG: hypothetical protein ACPGR7_07025 [Flavobacteriaceae bacterium]
MKIKTLALLLFFLTTGLFAQNVDSLDVVDKELLKRVYYPEDPEVPAYYQFKRKKTFFRKRSGRVEQVTIIHERLQIFSAEGYDFASVNLQLLSFNDRRERLLDFQGMTYNLDDNGEILYTPIDMQSILTTDLGQNFVSKSFTMPQVNIGSIIEYKYVVVSPFLFDISAVEVQSIIPVEELAVEVAVLDAQKVNIFQKGLYDFKIRVDTLISPGFARPIRNFTIYEQDVPAMIEEPLMGSMDLYISTLEFDVFGYVQPELGISEEFPHTWEKVLSQYISNDDYRYAQKPRSFYEDELVRSDSIEGAMNLVREKIQWNERFGAVPDYGIRDAYRLKKGNVADINLALLSMLRSLDIECYPVFTSSKFNGPILFPKSDALDYVLVAVKSADNYIYLDASDKYAGINDLPNWILNSEAFIVKSKKEIERVVLNSSSPGISTSLLSYEIRDNGSVSGKLQRRLMNYFAADFRAEYDENYNPYLGDMKLDSLDVKNTDLVFEPILEYITFSGDQDIVISENQISFLPLLFESIQDQIFESETRITPIEFGNRFNQRYVVQVKLPENYIIKSEAVNTSYKLPDNLGQIDFESSSIENQYKLILNFQINSPVISVDYYPYLVRYFDFLIKHTNEKVVFAKASESSVGLE